MKVLKTNEYIIKIAIKIKDFLYKYSTYNLFIISYYIYFLSLEPCYEGEELCGNKYEMDI
jgi:hypothetical protein